MAGDENLTPSGGGGGVPPGDEGVIIEFVDHEDEGPHSVPAADIQPKAAAPAREAPAAPGPSEEALQEAEDRYLRLLADFENYRKRADRERGESRATVTASLVKELLPVLDNLERALCHLPEGVPEEFQKGLSLILQQFHGLLLQKGLEPIDADGQAFDPAFHEACATVSSEEVPPNRVVDIIQKGYTMGGKLLRPAKVRVSAAPSGKGEGHA